MKFSDFNLSEELQRAVTEIGYDEPTEIQSQSIPLMLEGEDVIGHSRTGSGKTASFGLPAIDLVDVTLSGKVPQVLILCPTRELALQAAEEMKKFAKYKKGVRIVPIFGGQSIDLQIQQLRKGCHIIVGTPGRVMDHMRRHTIKLEELKLVVLDEADEMLNMGFREDIETILVDTPADRQTVLFSATMPKAILDITGKYQNHPKMVKIESGQLTVDTIEQSYFEIAKGRKTDALCLLLEYYRPKLSIVFCNTKKMVDELVTDLVKRGFAAQGLHGDMKQAQRTHVMNRFKEGAFGILIATDVAARGIDVNGIDIVFNYDLPDDDEYYVHRIGRTGRAGRDGRSFSLISGAGQYNRLREIARYTKSSVEKKQVPLIADIKSRNVEDLAENVQKYLDRHDPAKYVAAVQSLVTEECSLETVAAALFAMCMKKPSVKSDCGAAIIHNDRADSTYSARGRTAGRRNPNVRTKPKYDDKDMEEVRLSIGRSDGVTPSHILGAVAGESGLSGKLMGNIHIAAAYSTIAVPKQFKTRVIQSLNGAQVKGKKVTAQ